jgi:hypothetical protein
MWNMLICVFIFLLGVTVAADSIADFKARIQVTNDLTPTEEAGFKAHYMEQLKKNQPQSAVAPTQA